MYKKLIVILALTLSATMCSAQSEGLSFRITGGVNFAYMKEVPPITEAASHLGYMIGVNGNIGSHIFFQPGLQFTSYGVAIALPESEGTLQSRHELRANYIRVPLQVGLRLFDPSSVLGMFPVNVEIRGGVSGSILVGLSDKVKSGTNTPLTSDDAELFRGGLILGASVRLVFISLGLEYEHGLNKFFKNKGDSKLNVFYIVIGGYL
jgi:hypothetical protein